MKTYYYYYQPNKKQLKGCGDCTIRVLSKVLNISWLDAFDLTIPYCRDYQVSNIFDAPLKVEREIMDKIGFEYYGISNKKGTKRPTVKEFAKSHKEGKYILNIANHEVAVVDGLYWDIWDCGEKSLYGYYKLR